jgi:hypothetical protein
VLTSELLACTALCIRSEYAGAVGNYARYALRRVEGILNSGPSGFFPSVDQIQAYRERPPILATIELADGSPLTEDLPVTPDLDVSKVRRRLLLYGTGDSDCAHVWELASAHWHMLVPALVQMRLSLCAGVQVLDICTHFMELQDPRMDCFGIFVEDVSDGVCCPDLHASEFAARSVSTGSLRLPALRASYLVVCARRR